MPNGQQAQGFDVNGARQAGYSDDEIMAHLTQSRNFDVQGALKSGYSQGDIINYLASSPKQAAQQGTPIQNSGSIGPQPSGVLPWLKNLEGDVRYGSGNTAPGRVLQFLGAKGLNVGSQAQAGNFVGSPALGTIHAAQGLATIPSQPWQGLKQVASGALEASQIPTMLAIGPEGDAAAEGVNQATKGIRGAIGNFMRDPVTGKLKPLTRAAARTAGAAAGYEAGQSVGHPEAGLLIGGLMGPAAAEGLIPASQDAQYEQQAQMLMRRGREQAALDRQAARQAQETARANETPFEPTIYSSPQEPAQIEQRMANLKRQASSAGTYHAAQGSARRATTLQGRIGNKYLPFIPSE